MDGWIKLYRQMINWEWYKNTTTKVVFLHILLKVNYENKKWQGIDIPRGSYITSINNLADELGLTPRKIRTSLNNLKMTHEITIKTTHRYTCITLENYEKYQCCTDKSDTVNDKQNDTVPTQYRQQHKNIRNKEDNYILNINNKEKENFDLYQEGDDFSNYLKTKQINSKKEFYNLSDKEQEELIEHWFLYGG